MRVDGPINVNFAALKEAKKTTRLVMAALDKVLPESEFVVFNLFLDFGEIIAYFHPERWQDEGFHKSVADALNKLRKEYRDGKDG